LQRFAMQNTSYITFRIEETRRKLGEVRTTTSLML
jgi:hypothetical protein